MFSKWKTTSPKSMEEYVWLERITVFFDLCSMQWFIEVVKSLSSNLYPRLGLQGVTWVGKWSTQRQQVLATPALATTGACHIASQWWRLYLQHINCRTMITNAGGQGFLFWKEIMLCINIALCIVSHYYVTNQQTDSHKTQYKLHWLLPKHQSNTNLCQNIWANLVFLLIKLN